MSGMRQQATFFSQSAVQGASVQALLWLPDGKHIISASSDGTIQIKLTLDMM